MAFCGKCGAQANDGVKFCPACGASMAGGPTAAQPQYQTPPVATDGVSEQQADPNDVAQNKTMAILAYIIFFIPLITGDHKKSPFVLYHTNQGTVLALVSIIGSIVLSIIPLIGWILLPFFGIGVLVLWLMGILNAVNGKMKPLPVIGKFSLIK